MRHHGKVEPIPLGLVATGPIINVLLCPPLALRKALVASGREAPEIPAALLIDTGAQKTVVEDRIAQALQLKPIRFDSMVGVSQVPEDCPVYRACIVIGYQSKKGQDAHGIFEADIVGMRSPTRPMTHVGLLGRDFLRYVRFVYNGPTGSFDIDDGSYLIPKMSLKDATHTETERRLAEKKKARQAEKRRKSMSKKKGK